MAVWGSLPALVMFGFGDDRLNHGIGIGSKKGFLPGGEGGFNLLHQFKPFFAGSGLEITEGADAFLAGAFLVATDLTRR